MPPKLRERISEKLLEALQLHSDVVKKFPKRRIISKGIDELWAGDLLIMSKFAGENKGYNYILNIIDTFSKYMFLQPLKTKSGSEVASAFEKIIVKSGRCPKLLHVDRGKEFVNKNFNRVLEKYDIKMYHTNNEEKSAIAERLNRTLNKKFKVLFELNGNHKWVVFLNKIIREYNERDIHRSIGMCPANVSAKNEKLIREKLYPARDFVLPKNPNFQIDDRVRITCKKDTFEHKYTPNWTREIFHICRIFETFPLTYAIKDARGEEIIGKFYDKELLKVRSI